MKLGYHSRESVSLVGQNSVSYTHKYAQTLQLESVSSVRLQGMGSAGWKSWGGGRQEWPEGPQALRAPSSQACFAAVEREGLCLPYPSQAFTFAPFDVSCC